MIQDETSCTIHPRSVRSRYNYAHCASTLSFFPSLVYKLACLVSSNNHPGFIQLHHSPLHATKNDLTFEYHYQLKLVSVTATLRAVSTKQV